jgi:hypothetical protein
MTRRDERPRAVLELTILPGTGPATDRRPRADRIARARERIRQRYYDRGDVRRALVEALLVELAAPGDAR